MAMRTMLSLSLTNQAYGFPVRGAQRRILPPVLAVVHITGNAGNQGAHAAYNERNYANRADSPGPSAHYYIDRDGGGVHAIDETRYAAWSNGDLDQPALHNAGVAKLVALTKQRFNANEGCYLEIECVGTATLVGQWTDAQYETVADLIRDAASVTGLEINRSTVLTHADINSVDRANCAFIASHREIDLSRLISLARGDADVKPAPITDETPIEIQTVKGTGWFDLDGKTLLETQPTALDWRPSPYAAAGKRAMYGTLDGTRRLVLVVPSNTRPVPVPAPVPDPVAFLNGYNTARADATTAVAGISPRE